jgi:uncharacterized membrane protein (DUF485 family)
VATDIASIEKQSEDILEDTTNDQRNARYGLLLFAVYFAFYGSFMAINLAAPKLMSSESLGGMNVAIVFGFSLILAAIGLALVYMWMCSRPKSTEARR